MASSKSEKDATGTLSPLEQLNKNAAECIYRDLKLNKSVSTIQSAHLCPSLEWEGKRASFEEETSAFWFDLVSLWHSMTSGGQATDSFSTLLAYLMRRFSSYTPKSFYTINPASIRPLGKTPKDSQQPNVDLATDITVWLGGIRDDLRYRAFFSCAKDESGSLVIGLGSTAVKTGDIICLLLGCSIPVILRTSVESNHTLISDDYEPCLFSKDTRNLEIEGAGIDSDNLDTFNIV